MNRKLARRLAKTGTGVALALACTMAANQAAAVPYASMIRFGEPLLVGTAINVDLNYILNEDADEVTVEVFNNSTLSVVRTYNFTAPDPETTMGSHTIVWDGLDDSSLPVVVGGNEFIINVRVQKGDTTNTWTLITSNSGGAAATAQQSLAANFAPSDLKIPHDPTSPQFGRVYVAHDGTGELGGVMVLGSDLAPLLGNGAGPDLKGRHDAASSGTNGVWVLSFDPIDPDLLYWSGQAGAAVPRVGVFNAGALDPADIPADADGVFTTATAVRGAAIGIDGGGNRVGYIGHDIATSNVSRIDMDPAYPHAGSNQTALGTPGDIPYPLHMHVDDAGNLYVLSRNGATLRRWDSAVVDAAPGVPISTANASWTVELPTTNNSNGIGLHVDATTGDVFIALNEGVNAGIYPAGNVADAANVFALTQADRLIDYTDASLFPFGVNTSTLHHGIAFDWQGNAYVTSRTGVIYSLSPPGFETEYDITTSSPEPLIDDLLLITLESFSAHSAGVGHGVNIQWSTSSEIDNVGFHVNRVRLHSGSVVAAGRVNDSLIPAAGTSTDGASYSLVDTLPLAEGEHRGYVLVDIDANGNRTHHGPFRVQVRPADDSSERDWMMY